MDPILIIILAAVGLVAGPKLIKAGIAKLIATIDDNRRDNLTYNMLKKEYKEKQEHEKYRQILIKRGIDPDKVYNPTNIFLNLPFIGVKSKKKTVICVREVVSFNENEDVLLKGRLHIVDFNGKKTVQDIYLYQPRMFCSEKVFLGPKLDKTGMLSNKYTYLCRQAGGEILTGYLPKREILSGLQFDFIPDDAHSFIERNPVFNSIFRDCGFSDEDRKQAENLETFIHIDIPKDEKGQYIPVNLNDPIQKTEFEKYKRAHLGNKKTPREYFSEQLNIAKAPFYRYLNEYRPDYAVAARPTVTKDADNESIKVETSKKPEKSINDFYKRYDYYLDPIFGEKYNDYDGAYDKGK